MFGDSLSDPGNNALALGSTASPPFNVTRQSDITSNSFVPTYPYATSYQYSNGSVWAYQFATMLG
ncbi:MAG: GDSL family lipase, partial [Planctomycetia bacterium]|nr:GDSL family lipase [Planctomycetia bacterium]